MRETRHGISLGIRKSANPRLYERIRRILQADHVTVAHVGPVLLAVFVQAVELLCNAKLPDLCIDILTLKQFDRLSY